MTSGNCAGCFDCSICKGGLELIIIDCGLEIGILLFELWLFSTGFPIAFAKASLSALTRSGVGFLEAIGDKVARGIDLFAFGSLTRTMFGISCTSMSPSICRTFAGMESFSIVLKAWANGFAWAGWGFSD